MSQTQLLAEILRETVETRKLIQRFVYAMIDGAEAEIPEFMRRFANYMHDLHDIKYMYEEHGQPAPQHLLDELQRCDDRYRQLVKKLNEQGGTFERVRREMAADPENRWDHTKLLAKPQEK